MQENTKVVKATLWYTVSNIILRGVSLFTAPIFTRLLSTADYGIASNFSAWASIILCFTSLSLSTAVIRGKIEFKEKYKEFLSSVQTLGFIWSVICALMMCLSIEYCSDFMKLDKICITVMLFYLIVYPSLTYAQIDYKFDYRYKENVAISIINTIGNVFCSIGLILIWTEQRYLGRVIGMVAPIIIMGTWFAIQIYKQGKCLINLEYWRYALKISLPMIPHGLAMIVLGQIDRIMIIKYCGESEAGIYSFGYSYGILLSVVTNAINEAVQPQMYEMLENGEEGRLADFSYKLMLIGVMMSTILVGVGPEALRILGTNDYFEARWVIFPVVVGTMMQYMYQFFGVIEIYSNKTICMAVGSSGAAVVNYILNIHLIPKFGFVAAAYTTFLSYALLMAFHFIMTKIVTKKRIFEFFHVAGIFLLIVMIGLVINCLYNYMFVMRYMITLLVLIAIGFLLRKTIRELFNQTVKKAKG